MLCCSCLRLLTGPAGWTAVGGVSLPSPPAFPFCVASHHPREPGCPRLSGDCCLGCEAGWAVPRPRASWKKGAKLWVV